ncbi:NMCC_0638 family (lipo)protein [Kangiella sediminilitoris]|nr:hypothetical protein [Kangiella sediminilitoris]
MSVARVSAEDFNPNKYVAEGAVMLFWNACVKFYPKEDKFNNWIDKNDFDVVPNSMAGSFARGPDSRVYSVNNSGVRYLLVAEPSGLCSVFVKDVNQDFASQAFSRWQNAFKEKGWVHFDNVETQTKEKGQLTTTHYQYTSSGQEVMTVVVSKAQPGLGSFQLAMSASYEPGVNQ